MAGETETGGVPHGGIRRRLVALVLAAVLPVIAFAGIATWRFAAAEQGALERTVLLRAEDLARALDAEFGTVATALRTIAAAAAFQEGDLRRLHGLLAAVGNDLGASLSLRDADGALLLHSSFSYGRPLPAAAANDTFAAAAPASRAMVTDLMVSPVTAGHDWAVALPARDDAGRLRILTAGLPATSLLDLLRRKVPSAGWTAAVVDRSLRLVVRSTRPEEAVGRQTRWSPDDVGRIWRTMNPEGMAVVAASARSEAGWIAGVSLDAATVDAPVRRATWALGLLGAAMTSAAVGLALFSAGRIARGIGRLAAAATALGAGAAVPPIRGGVRELDEVGAALALASRTIRAREAALEDREAALTRTQRLARAGGFEIVVTHGGSGPRFRNIRSPEYLHLHGLGPDDAGEAHAAWARRVHPEDRARVEANFREAILGPGAEYAADYRIILPDGETRWISARAEIERDPDGRAARMRGVHVDLTALRRTQARLRENEAALEGAEERLRLAVEAGDLVAWEVDAATGEGVASPRHFALLGVPVPPGGRARHADWDAAIVEEDRPGLAEARKRLLAGDGVFRAEYRIRSRDGTVRWVASSGRRVPGTSRVTGVYADITERKEAERVLQARVRAAVATAEAAQAQLAQARKLEALGHLTGGVAHDFNNLLQVVAAGATLLRKRAAIAGDAGATRLIDGIAGAAERGAGLVSRMLAFARRQDLHAGAVDTAALVTGMRDILTRSVGPAMPVELDLPPDLWWIWTDTNQLELALLNLCVNARDAMPPDRFPDGGIRIAARNVAVGGDGDAPGAGEWVALSVTDTGAGMDADTLARAAEPFFTTKGVGKGTGLGLSMVHGLCEQSGGALRLRSIPGQGTVAEMWLPRAPVGSGVAAEAAAAPAAWPGGLSVLLVDDDPLVLSSTAALLADLGHSVRETGSGAAALDLLRDGAAPAVLLTDHAMPGMTGLDLAHAATALRPGLPVILASGYADLPEGGAAGLVRLAKPFTREALARALTEAVPGG